jgi:hypothetical protein
MNYLLFWRIEQDGEVDVFQTIKTIRNNRPQFIEDKVWHLLHLVSQGEI